MTKHFIFILLLICSQILGVPSKNDFNKKFIDVASTGNPTIVSIISETVKENNMFGGFGFGVPKEFEDMFPQFEERGIKTIAVSTDDEERANKMTTRINAKNLRVGYGFSLGEARDWGLYISNSRGKTSIGIEEPKLFAEPGLFIVTPEQTLYYSSVQTMPFVRPSFSELLKAIDFMIEKNYPARGEYSGEL